jgi:hypothetical protein
MGFPSIVSDQKTLSNLFEKLHPLFITMDFEVYETCLCCTEKSDTEMMLNRKV